MTGTWCCELELSGLVALTGVEPFGGQEMARVLVRLHGEPLGYLTERCLGGLPAADEVRGRASQLFASRLAAHLLTEGSQLVAGRVPEPGEACPNRLRFSEFVTVVVCTRDRSDILTACLRRLQAVDYPHVEFVIVDNAATGPATRDTVSSFTDRDRRFRYVAEPLPGLSRARNRGLSEARGDVVAYTDDDVAVDPGWVHGLLLGFARHPDAACVTGLVCTASVNGEAEAYFDARAASWSTRCEPEIFDLSCHRRDDPLYPYSPGIFGTGANFAFRRSVLVELGGFDDALGAGSLTKGGEDLDAFVRVLNAGHGLVYEPSGIVWHHHRADRSGLLKQMFAYGTGLSAFMTKCLLSRGTRGDVLRRIPLGLLRMTAIRSETEKRLASDVARPPGALSREFLGFIAGPLLYARAERASRRLRVLQQ